MKKLINYITERTDWEIYECGNGYYELETYIDTCGGMGQDKDLVITVAGDTPAEFIENIYAIYQDYDPDEEAALWIGPDGHGRDGAPYRLSDLLQAEEDAKSAIFQLHTDLEYWYEITGPLQEEQEQIYKNEIEREVMESIYLYKKQIEKEIMEEIYKDEVYKERYF